MPKSNVFICHASEDEAFVAGLVRHVDPVLRKDLPGIRLWEDGAIPAGEPWSEYIKAVIDESFAAVVIVSEHLLNSTYAMEKEMPPLLARAEVRDLLLLCLYVRPSLADEYRFTIEIGDQTLQRSLTHWQGLNPFDKPLSAILPKARRDQALVLAARRLLATLKRTYQPFP